jgi:hypothetical protein
MFKQFRLDPRIRAFRVRMACLLIVSTSLFAACGMTAKTEEPEEDALARTEFTDRIENFFEFTPLKAGKPSQFLIHLSELATGEPIEKAEVSLMVRPHGGGQVDEVKAKVGRVTGIYVAEVTIANRGDYDIEFRVKNDKVDERMPLEDFKVE